MWSWRRLLEVLLAHEMVSYPTAGNACRATARLPSATSGTTMPSWSEPALTGFISERYVYLLKQTSPRASGFRIRFVGSFEPDEDNARLVGGFVFPWSGVAVFVVGVGVCLGWLVKTFFVVLNSGTRFDEFRYAIVAALGAGAVVSVARWVAARDKRWLNQQIKSALGDRTSEGNSA